MLNCDTTSLNKKQSANHISRSAGKTGIVNPFARLCKKHEIKGVKFTIMCNKQGQTKPIRILFEWVLFNFYVPIRNHD